MYWIEDKELAAACAERHDSRLVKLAHKEDMGSLPATELAELVDRMEEAWCAFGQVRREMGVDTPEPAWWW